MEGFESNVIPANCPTLLPSKCECCCRLCAGARADAHVQVSGCCLRARVRVADFLMLVVVDFGKRIIKGLVVWGVECIGKLEEISEYVGAQDGSVRSKAPHIVLQPLLPAILSQTRVMPKTQQSQWCTIGQFTRRNSALMRARLHTSLISDSMRTC
jgi:hypothetical protein